ncbi:hypothetical protein ACZ11_01265 [Lysinibacillus xylanilyticus]|uniref:Uncharacterized protein n=1 Tax=Lysinibacillus xylanilyticus TaxID=582475 RepID=A0A0K9FGX8_9BACI|nr:hypothetical protein [Lysinibacillus xylanilyticus]KMY33740.1 hypothetical protein ACZ11_01265 [Lysinibacillus xylanilyticus]
MKSFNHYVVHRKIHKVMNGSLGQLDEKGVQALFGMFATEYLKHFNIVISSEVDTGRGTVDFYISYGYENRALLEFKLGSHQRVNNGIEFQLPIYLISEEISFGIFILICYTQESYLNSEYLYEEAKKQSKKYNKEISFYRIDATGTLKTGSTIKTMKDMNLEDWRRQNGQASNGLDGR